MVNLANCRGDSGDLESAGALEDKALAVMREVLGDHHPDTLVCEANLAVTRHQAGRARDAEELRIQTLGRLGQVVGLKHPLAGSLKKWRRIDLDLEALSI
jgi:hypothetical protein